MIFLSALLILPGKLQLVTSELLQFDCPGLLQDPDFKILREAIHTLISGGRVVRLKDRTQDQAVKTQSTMGLGQWLLLSGLQQINMELQNLDLLLDPPPQN